MKPPRYPVVLDFTIADMAPYVGASPEAVKFCESLFIRDVQHLRRRVRYLDRWGCTDQWRTELMRLLDPPGIPADWPPHPDPGIRVRQQVAHLPGSVRHKAWRALPDADDPWKAFLFLVHFKTDLQSCRGIGAAGVPEIEAWRTEMRARHPKPEQPLSENDLQRTPRAAAQPYCPQTGRMPARLQIIIDLDASDPFVVDKVDRIMRALR